MKNIVKLVLMFLLVGSLFSKEIEVKPELTQFDILLKEYNNFTTEQMDTMLLVYLFGEQHNLEWSLTAIAWEETKFGIFKVPVDTCKDYGLMKHNIYWFLKRNKIPDTIWNRSKYGTKLVIDDLYSLKESVKILRMGEKVKKSWESYRAVWGYYNSGTIYNDELGIQYGERI